jgi:hypothetical protein
VHPITNVTTTPANVAEAKCKAAMQRVLVAADRAPNTHLADAGYIAADLLVQSDAQYGIRLVGPVQDSARWQHHVEGAYAVEQFTAGWAGCNVRCPQEHYSIVWYPFQHANGHHAISE